MTRNRLNRLKKLREILDQAINDCDSKRDLAALSRQYRETLKDIEEIEGAESNDDDIAAIISEREAAGKAGAVR